MSWVPLLLAATADLRPLKPDAVPQVPWLVVLGVPSLVMTTALVASRLRGNARAVEPDIPTRTPESLQAQLERIRKGGWLEAGYQLRACEVMTDVMRDLAQSRFDVLSLPLTTAELLVDLAARGAPEGLCRPLGDILTACDLVKFAGVRLEPSELQGYLETATILIDRYGPASDPTQRGETSDRASRSDADLPPGPTGDRTWLA